MKGKHATRANKVTEFRQGIPGDSEVDINKGKTREEARVVMAGCTRGKDKNMGRKWRKRGVAKFLLFLSPANRLTDSSRYADF